MDQHVAIRCTHAPGARSHRASPRSTGSFSGPVAAGGNGTILVGNGGAKLGAPGLISYRTNGGAKWVPGSGLPVDQTVEAIAGHTGSATFFAYCYGGDLYVSNDGGGSWALVSHAMRAGTG